MPLPPLSSPCPCGLDQSLDACCGRLLRGEAQAVTAEELMRSRYTANAVSDTDHLFRTWHPRTRPDDVRPEPSLQWVGLRILDTRAGGVDDETGEVEFEASWQQRDERGVLRERSRFSRRAGRWMYVDGDVS